MKTREVTVTSRVDGSVEKAKLFLCDKCGGSEFIIYTIGEPGHPHLQCIACDTTFCQGNSESLPGNGNVL